jgi:hypothetical protein
MRNGILIAAAALLALQVGASTSFAEDASPTVTLAGNIVCAKCTLKVEGLKECHNVLVVTDDAQRESQYWLVKNDVSKAFGEVCETVKPVTVTGAIEEKDGKHWIAPSKIEPRQGS